MREPVCEKFESLKPKFEKGDFRRNISVMARDISNSSMDKITQKANSVTVLLKNSVSLKERDRTSVLSVVPSLIRSTNKKENIEIGLEIVKALGVEEEVSLDILSGLNTLSQHDDENLKERAVTLLKKFENKAGV
jgi:hypothetical protein